MASLIEDTLSRSANVSVAELSSALACCAPAVRLLAAGGYLDHEPLVLVAPPVHLSLFTVTGTSALTIEESTGPVPGGSQVMTWVLHLPAPVHLAKTVGAIIAGNDHLSTAPAPDETDGSATHAAVVGGPSIDRGALASRLNDPGTW